MEHIEYAHTYGMDETELQERIKTTETGVLSLADEGVAYGIPLNHYYDGERLFFRLGVTENSTKSKYMDTTEKAQYVLYGAEPTSGPEGLDSWSVIISGQLVEIPESEYDRFDTAEINQQFTPIRVFGESIDDIEIVIVELEIESMTGRTTSA